jgi:hypothetical protein
MVIGVYKMPILNFFIKLFIKYKFNLSSLSNCMYKIDNKFREELNAKIL